MISFVLIGLIVFVSFRAWKDQTLYNKFIFSPYDIHQNKEWHRFITSGFIHADYAHLGFNCFSLYIFADVVIYNFERPYLFGHYGQMVFVLLFLLGVVVADIPSYLKHKNFRGYRSLGASGGVSSVIFAGILLAPLSEIMIFPFPFGIPAFIFGILYLGYSYYMSQNSNDNINHSAHLIGSVFGVVFLIALKPGLIRYFIDQIAAWI